MTTLILSTLIKEKMLSPLGDIRIVLPFYRLGLYTSNKEEFRTTLNKSTL